MRTRLIGTCASPLKGLATTIPVREADEVRIAAATSELVEASARRLASILTIVIMKYVYIYIYIYIYRERYITCHSYIYIYIYIVMYVCI